MGYVTLQPSADRMNLAAERELGRTVPQVRRGDFQLRVAHRRIVQMDAGLSPTSRSASPLLYKMSSASIGLLMPGFGRIEVIPACVPP